MAGFQDMALAIAKKRQMDATNKVTQLSSAQKQLAETISIQSSQAKLEQGEAKDAVDALTAEQKQEKLRNDVLKKLIDQQGGPVQAGGNVIDSNLPEVTPEAQGLPIIDNPHNLS